MTTINKNKVSRDLCRMLEKRYDLNALGRLNKSEHWLLHNVLEMIENYEDTIFTLDIDIAVPQNDSDEEVDGFSESESEEENDSEFLCMESISQSQIRTF